LINDETLRRNFEVIERLRGWFDLEACMLLGELRALRFQEALPILEVGVFCGRSLAALASLYPDVRTLGVDPFYPDFGQSPAFADEAEILRAKAADTGPEERIAALQRALAELDRRNGTGLSAHVTLHRETEEAFLARNTERFQLIHIDGEHTFAAVTRSLDHLPRTLAANGWLIVDDFLHAGFPDISEAVHRHPSFRRDLWPIAFGANKGVFLRTADIDGVRACTAGLAERYRTMGAVLREMHDGALAVDLSHVARRPTSKRGLGRRLRRMFR